MTTRDKGSSGSSAEPSERLGALLADMRAKSPLIRSNDYGNCRAIASLIDSWVDVLAALAEAQPEPRQAFSDHEINLVKWALQRIAGQADVNGLVGRVLGTQAVSNSSQEEENTK